MNLFITPTAKATGIFLLTVAIFAQAQGITVEVKKSSKSKWEALEAQTVAGLTGFSYTPEHLNRYGSLVAKSADATRFYRVHGIRMAAGSFLILTGAGTFR